MVKDSYIGMTLHGLEPVAVKETKGKKILAGRVLYEKKKVVLKSVLQSYKFLKKFSFRKIEDIIEKSKKIDFGITGRFRVDCHREGEHRFLSQDVKEILGEYLFNKGHAVDLDNPKTVIFVDIVNNNCFIGKDPKKFSKRDYKIRSGSSSINSTIAYSLLDVSDFKRGKVLVDPFCGDGSILIEAGLLGGKKLYGFEDDLKNARINMKVAKVKIDLSKHEIDWLDTLFKKESVDLIISHPPFFSKRRDRETVQDKLKGLFYQADYILKKNGEMVLLARDSKVLESYGKEFGFSMKKELKVQSGSVSYEIVKFKKRSKSHELY